MDPDPYTNSRLLYKSDRNIASIYSQVMRAALGDPVNQEELLREIDSLIFQNFKYKTALLSAQKDHEVNASTQSKAGTSFLIKISTSKRAKQKSSN